MVRKTESVRGRALPARGIVDAVSRTFAARATIVFEDDDPDEENPILEFDTFEAEIQETTKPKEGQPRNRLLSTDRIVEVDFKHRTVDMKVGENLTIAPKAGGGWAIVWWECDE